MNDERAIERGFRRSILRQMDGIVRDLLRMQMFAGADLKHFAGHLRGMLIQFESEPTDAQLRTELDALLLMWIRGNARTRKNPTNPRPLEAAMDP